MRDGAHASGAEGEDEHAPIRRPLHDGRCVGRPGRQAENDDIGLNRGRIDDDLRALTEAIGDEAGVGVIGLELAHVVVERVQAGCGKECRPAASRRRTGGGNGPPG